LPEEKGATANHGEPLAWIREHLGVVAAVIVVLLILWLASGESHRENGRYVLVKDDVPCQFAGDANGRRWCYVVLDTRTGKLEERVRKLGRD
jgi:hypothetical protein